MPSTAMWRGLDLGAARIDPCDSLAGARAGAMLTFSCAPARACRPPVPFARGFPSRPRREASGLLSGSVKTDG
jgi:hypothetical protein